MHHRHFCLYSKDSLNALTHSDYLVYVIITEAVFDYNRVWGRLDPVHYMRQNLPGRRS
jgi:tRNA splicing endonuclease